MEHIESNYGTEPYTVDYESHLADVVTALELLSITYPALRKHNTIKFALTALTGFGMLVHQFGQVQIALGRVRGLGSTFSVEVAEF